MSSQAADLLLHRLLDACERRSDPQARAISTSVAQAPGYLDERDPGRRREINAALLAWQARGWLRLRWVRGEEGNLLDRAALVAEAAPEVYAHLGRRPSGELRDDLAALLEEYRGRLSPALAQILAGIAERLAAGQAASPFRPDEPQRNADLLRALAALDGLEEELPERTFSARILGDSKRLAALKPALLGLLRRARPELTGLRDGEAWAALGVLANPGHVYLHGPTVLRSGGSLLDVGACGPDLGVPVAALARLEVVEVRAPYLLTVENRTAFYDQVTALPGDGIVVYLGGFPSPARRLLLRRLGEAAPALPFYHWGDLDYGGFAILAHLRGSLGRPVQPHLMDLATLERCAAAGRPLGTADRRNLRRLLDDDLLADCRGVIGAILERGVKVEQEVVGWARPIRSSET